MASEHALWCSSATTPPPFPAPVGTMAWQDPNAHAIDMDGPYSLSSRSSSNITDYHGQQSYSKDVPQEVDAYTSDRRNQYPNTLPQNERFSSAFTSDFSNLSQESLNQWMADQLHENLGGMPFDSYLSADSALSSVENFPTRHEKEVLSLEDAAARRRRQNRDSQRAFRERKRNLIKDLTARHMDLRRKYDELRDMYASMCQQVIEMKQVSGPSCGRC